jgi:predicted Zn-dependent peptidase
VENERQVLIEENQMYRDRPAGFGKTWEELFRLGFTTHRYRNPIGGPDANLADTPRERILTHLHRYYVPGNIVYVVAGDVDPEEVFAAMAEVFADFPERPVAIDVSPAEPPQSAFRFKELPGDVNRVYGKLGFHIPGELHADADALAVFAHILGEGRSGRLYREVRERQGLVSSISVTSVNGFDPGLFIVDFQADADKAVDAVVAIMAEVGRFQREPVAPADLARTKQMVRSGYIFGLETAEGQASVLGHYATLGDLAAAAEYPERIAAVTAEQVMDVARRYFDLSPATLLLHAPRRHAGARPGAARGAPGGAARRGRRRPDACRPGAP